MRDLASFPTEKINGQDSRQIHPLLRKLNRPEYRPSRQSAHIIRRPRCHKHRQLSPSVPIESSILSSPSLSVRGPSVPTAVSPHRHNRSWERHDNMIHPSIAAKGRRRENNAVGKHWPPKPCERASDHLMTLDSLSTVILSISPVWWSALTIAV